MIQRWTKVLPSFVRPHLGRRSDLQRIVSNIGWLSVDRVLRMGVGLVVGVWVARYLGPEQFGLYNYAAAFVALFGTVASLGLDGIVVRDLVREPVDKAEILGMAFLLKLVGGILMFLMTLGAVAWMRPGDRLTLWVVGILATGAIFQAFDAIDFWFQSQIQSKYTVYAKAFAFLLMAVMKIGLILVGAPLIAFAWAFLAETVLGALGLTFIYRRRTSQLEQWRLSLQRAKNWLHVAWPLMMAGAAIMVYMKIDQVMLGNMIGDREVGIYSAAVRVSELWYFIPAVVSSSIYPTLVKLYNQSEELFYDKLKQIMGYYFWGSLILSVAVASFSGKIIAFLYGPEYAKAAGVLSIHIYSVIIISMSVVFSQKFVLDGTTKVSLYGTIAGAVSNVVLNLWLIPPKGAYGAAIATLLSYAVPVLFQSVFFDRRIGLLFLASTVYPLRPRNAGERRSRVWLDQ